MSTQILIFSAILSMGQEATPQAEPPPKFAVRISAEPPPPKFTPRTSYQQCRLAVLAGRRCTLYVGVARQVESATSFHVESLPGFSTGVYECWQENGVPMMRIGTQVAPKFTDEHQCPKCGTFQYTQSHTMPDGSHTHTCPNCGTSWNHGGHLGYTRQFSFQFGVTRQGG